jgi:NitT/TauT family transport system substrate-binding protein
MERRRTEHVRLKGTFLQMTRSGLVSVAVVILSLACMAGGLPPHAVHAAPSYNLMMNWFPEPEEGGFYEAQRLNLYAKAGIASTVVPFRRVVTVEPYVLSGQVAFGMGDADELLQYNARGAHLVAIMNTFQTNPLGILWHADDKTIHSVADLSNHTLIYSFGVPFEPYLVAKYHYKNFSTKANDYSSRAFAADPKAVHQCYVTSEPYLYEKQGLKVKYALISESGFDPYADLIYTTQAFAKSHSDVVRAFVRASVQGWYSYLKNPGPTLSYLRGAPGVKSYPETPDAQQFSFSQMQRYGLVDGGDAKIHGIGWFNPLRWTALQQQMDAVGLNVRNVDVGASYTDAFLPPTHPSGS